MTEAWLKGLVTFIIALAAIGGAYALLTEAYDACEGTGDTIGEFDIPENISLMACITSTPLLTIFSIGGMALASAGFWFAISGFVAFATGFGDKKK